MWVHHQGRIDESNVVLFQVQTQSIEVLEVVGDQTDNFSAAIQDRFAAFWPGMIPWPGYKGGRDSRYLGTQGPVGSLFFLKEKLRYGMVPNGDP